MGDQKVSRGRRNRCLWWGEAVSGRSVQREGGGRAAKLGEFVDAVRARVSRTRFMSYSAFVRLNMGCISLQPSVTLLWMYRLYGQRHCVCVGVGGGLGAAAPLAPTNISPSVWMGLVHCGMASLRHNITGVVTYQSCDPCNNRPSVCPVPFKSAVQRLWSCIIKLWMRILPPVKCPPSLPPSLPPCALRPGPICTTNV